MAQSPFTPFLRRVLLFDAVTCLLMGIALLAAGGTLEQMLEIPAGVSQAAGVVLLIFAAAVGYVGTRTVVLRPAVWAIVALNALWAVESVMVLVLGWLQPNAFGQVFVIAQAVAVAIIAELQFMGMRRARVA